MHLLYLQAKFINKQKQTIYIFHILGQNHLNDLLGSSCCCLGEPLQSMLPSQHEAAVICNRQDKLITFKLIFDTV